MPRPPCGLVLSLIVAVAIMTSGHGRGSAVMTGAHVHGVAVPTHGTVWPVGVRR